MLTKYSNPKQEVKSDALHFIFKYRLFFAWLAIYFIIFIMAYFRPIHQDDGWYASYALRLIQKLNPEEQLSYWSFLDANDSDMSIGFIFSSLQVPFYLTFGFNVFAVRVLNSILLTLSVYLAFQIVKTIAKRFEWLFVFLLLVNPIFYYHFYNRPEVVALVLVLLSILLMLKKDKKHYDMFFAFALWGLIIDAHPIAILSVFGIGLWTFYDNPNFRKQIVLGGIIGLGFYFIGNKVINGNFGLFNAFFNGEKPGIGDHYIPIFESNLNDFSRIFINRWNGLKLTIIFSGVWLIVPILFYRKAILSRTEIAIVFNLIIFVILSTLLTEASGNGWALYALAVFLLTYVILIKHLRKTFALKSCYAIIIILIPLMLYSTASTSRRLYINISKSHYARNNFNNVNWDSCLPSNSKVLMRPTFVFELANRNLLVDLPFGILNVMKNNKISFKEAIIKRKYDYIAIDERSLNNELLINVRELWTQPYYREFNETGITREGFQQLIDQGFLQYHCSVFEPMHGETVIYRINY